MFNTAIITSEDKPTKRSESTDEDKNEIETLGLGSMSNDGFARLSEHRKPNEPEKEKKKFIGFG